MPEWISGILSAIFSFFGAATLIKAVILVAIVIFPTIFIIFRKYDIPLKIGSVQISPKKSRNPNKEIVVCKTGPKPTRTHRTCPLYSHIVLLLEAAKEHSKSINTIEIQERLAAQMRVTDQQLKFLAAFVKTEFMACLDKNLGERDDNHRDRVIVFSLVAAVAAAEVKVIFKDLFITRQLLEMKRDEWDEFKASFTKELILSTVEIVQKIYPHNIFEDAGCSFEELLEEESFRKDIKKYVENILDMARDQEQIFLRKEEVFKLQFINTINKIVDCEIDINLSVDGLKDKEP